MTQQEEQRFKELERRLQEIEEWVAQKKQNQLSYPLDPASITIIQTLP